MIVISAGLVKSGSGLYFNLTNDLLAAGGGWNIRDLRDRFHLHGVLRNYNCNIGALTPENLEPLLKLHRKGYTFVIKTHASPQPHIWELIDARIVKATCIIRDPRDVVLSAMSHGRRILEQGQNHTFAAFTTFEKVIPAAREWMDVILDWLTVKKQTGVLPVRYESLIKDPIGELEKLADFLEIRISRPQLETRYSAYSPDVLSPELKDYLHYDVGRTGRHLELPKEQSSMLTRVFKPYLRVMGYPLTEKWIKKTDETPKHP